ncbi:TetR/AcrR family transcriptional regulator [Agrococcus beijingensis]|uniref:TetR/AcrR family transcriptional regulator n=1 Tax=Agrococcus beijingensis TaxID=3068634 RepID=UPI0027404BFE|nr:TetR/AcrR family transcriptional regulator [Agrococcus sp. REN33]
MGRPRLHDEQLRQRLLEAATDLMASDGPDFSLRPLVASVGTSTSAVYSLFGSRGELLEAITLRAARSFVDAQLAVDVVHVPERIPALAHAMRDWARGNATKFQVVFGRTEGSAAIDDARESTTEPLLHAVSAAIDVGYLDGDAAIATQTIFAGVHGFITLELLGHYLGSEADALFDELLSAAQRSWAAPEYRTAVA